MLLYSLLFNKKSVTRPAPTAIRIVGQGRPIRNTNRPRIILIIVIIPNVCTLDKNSMNGIPTTAAHITGSAGNRTGTYPKKLAMKNNTKYNAVNTPILIRSFTLILFIDSFSFSSYKTS